MLPAENISTNFYKIEIINQYPINANEYSSSYGEKLGDGHFVWSDGKEYVGNFKAGWMEGYGELIWPDGRSYIGDWRRNKCQGYH